MFPHVEPIAEGPEGTPGASRGLQRLLKGHPGASRPPQRASRGLLGHPPGNSRGTQGLKKAAPAPLSISMLSSVSMLANPQLREES